jgi:hypothetical protein
MPTGKHVDDKRAASLPILGLIGVDPRSNGEMTEEHRKAGKLAKGTRGQGATKNRRVACRPA